MLKGKIIDVREDGTAVIEAPIDIGQFIHRKVKEVYIDPIDSRPLSDRQRRMCYALIKAIADWSGSDAEEIKEALSGNFCRCISQYHVIEAVREAAGKAGA